GSPMVITPSRSRSFQGNRAAGNRTFLRVVASCLLALAAAAHPPRVHAQTQSCGSAGQSACAPPAPVSCTIPSWSNAVTICQALPVRPWIDTNGSLPYGYLVPGKFNYLPDYESAVIAAYHQCAPVSVVGV